MGNQAELLKRELLDGGQSMIIDCAGYEKGQRASALASPMMTATAIKDAAQTC